MNDRRFLSTLNQVAESMGFAPLEPASGRSEAEAIRMWAEFLKHCVERGVSVGDPRKPPYATSCYDDSVAGSVSCEYAGSSCKFCSPTRPCP